jgi:hypothetical protein
MERKIIYTLFIMILLPSFCFAKVNLEVLNPRTEIEPQAISNPMERIGDLTGKKIGLYWNRKAGGNNFWDGVEKNLKEKYPTATILRYEGAFDLGEALAKKMAKEVDVFMYGVGD